MQNNRITRLGAIALGLAALTATSCSSDDPIVTPPATDKADGDKYVIAAAVDETSSLVAVDTISKGTVTVKGNGLEVDGGVYWIFKNKKSLFRLTYNQGSAGTGSSYYLDATTGKITEDLTFECQRFSTYGTWGDNVITASTGNTTVTDADGNYAQGFLINYLDSNTGEVSGDTYPAENYLGNGEKVSFSGFVETNGKLYTSVIPMGMSKYGVKAFPDKVTDQDLIAKTDGGSGSGQYKVGEIPSTQFPDSAFVAIYSGENFSETPVIARTGKIGYASGRMRSQYYQTIWAADNGDVYVFSPGFGRTTTSSADLKRVTGQLPSGVVRIKAGATDFDPDYYVNIETIGNKHPLYRCWHITEDYFLVQFYTKGLDARGQNTLELGVFRGSTGTLTMVSGLPDTEKLTSFGSNPFAEDDAIYMPVVTNDGNYPALYRIDAATATAKRGIEIQAESVSAVGLLSPRNN